LLRKICIALITGLLALTVACSSSSTSTVSSAANAGNATGTAAAATSCPTSNTKSFAKTRFVADVALAGGAFKRYIYTPAKAGKFKKGAKGKVTALVKAAAAGAFTINRLKAASSAAQANPTLCKLLAQPIAKFSAAVTGLIGKSKGGLGSIDPSDVTNPDSYLSDLHNAASQGGAAFTDNTNTSA
jgi:hypothetical protein